MRNTNAKAWGFNLDYLEMAYLPITDETYNEFLLLKKNDDDCLDPRRGPFYAIVAGLLKKQKEAERVAR